MNVVSADDLQKVYEKHPWNTRSEYRALRKQRPEFNLPSDKIISKQWGSFSKFKSIVIEGKDAVTIATEDIINKYQSKYQTQSKSESAEDVEKARNKISSLLGTTFSRKDYRYFRKNNPESQLPSCTQIDKLFGSFGNLKKQVQQEPELMGDSVNVISNEEASKPFVAEEPQQEACDDCKDNDTECTLVQHGSCDCQKEHDEIKMRIEGGPLRGQTKHVTILDDFAFSRRDNDPQDDLKEEIIDFVRKIWSDGEEFSRSDYREKRRLFPADKMPSCHQLEKIFGSFTSFRNIVLGRTDVISSDGVDWEVTPANIKKWRAEVKAVREELFRGEREPYRWDPESRRGRMSWA